MKDSGSNATVAKHEAITSPRMRVCNFNIAGVARSNFEICVDRNGDMTIFKKNASVDVVKVGADVDETIVTLRGGDQRGDRGQVVVVALGMGEGGGLWLWWLWRR